ncbi:Nn.00g040280.m01.CDS01 [Neocucurbitaria sp. VM-36]
MPFSSKFKESGLLPTVEETFGSKYTSKNMDDKTKDNLTVTAPIPPQPTPLRTHSTRIQEPIRIPSQSSTRPPVQRNASITSNPPKPIQDKPQRPPLSRRHTTARTRYIDMLLGLDSVSPTHNILASLSVWILLAGYIVFPATFSKLQKDSSIDDKADTNIKQHALRTVRNVPLLYVAAFACGIGVVGCLWLWWVHRKNYVWVINRIFLPALLNSIAGLVSTVVNVYSAQDGQYSVTATVTIIVTSACSVVAAALFLLYNTVMLRLVKRKHEREIKAAERQENERYMTTQEMKDDGREV